MKPPVLVLACGALDRSDDAAGLLAAAALRDRLAATGGLDAVEIEVVGDLSVDDLVERPATQRILVVDAAAGPAPGEVVRLRFEAVGGARARPRSSHELPVPEMLGLAALLAGRPLEGEVVAIGIASAAYGDTLTPAVAAGMPRFLQAIAEAAGVASHLAVAPGANGAAGALDADGCPPGRRHLGAARARRPTVPANRRRPTARWRRPTGAGR